MNGLKRVGVVLGLVGLVFVGTSVYANSSPWPLPVGEPIIIREYPSWEEGGPSGILNVAVTDVSVWWEIQRGIPHDPRWWRLVRYDRLTETEEEFHFDYRTRQFVVTVDDADLLYTTWDSPPCSEEGDCIFQFDVSGQTSVLLFESAQYTIWDPDLDGNWLVWRAFPNHAYLMNWRGVDTPISLDPDFASNPRISCPWVVWTAQSEVGLYPHAWNMETGATVDVSIAPKVIGDHQDVDDGLFVYSVGKYLLTHLYLLDLNDPESIPRRISWDNGAERPRIHNKLVVWDYYDGASGRSAIQGLDLETGLTFDIGVRGGMHSYNVRNHIIAWSDRTYYPEAQVFIMLTRPYPLRGDLNGDNVVDITDLMLIAQHWRAFEGDPDYDKGWDLNWDGSVDIVDIMLVALHWGETWPPPTPTPTPTPTMTPTPTPSPTPTSTPTPTPTPTGTPVVRTVGGAIVPVNKFEVLGPWLCVGFLGLLSEGVWMIRHIP